MSMLTVRNLDPEVKERLRRRAAAHGRSMEAEVRHILTVATQSEEPPSDIVSAIMRNFGDIEITLELPDRAAAQQRPVEL
jgi:plasmid stability protein